MKEPEQLALVDPGDAPEWQLDENAREAARRGLAAARDALRRAARRAEDDRAA